MSDVIEWKDKELILHTFQQSHVNGGRLSKFWVEDRLSHREFMLKGSTHFGYEPLSEKIAYEVGKALGIDVLEYDIVPLELFEDKLPLNSHCGYVSICEKIDRKGYSITSVAEIKRARNTVEKSLHKDSKYCKVYTNREIMYELLSKKYIDRMFLFDAIIGNKDRHYGNVHLLRGRDGRIIGAPIIDNGDSCLATTRTIHLQLLGYNIGKVIDESATIEKKHEKQIMYADTLNGIDFDIPTKTIEILEAIQSTLDLMPKQRANAVEKYLVYRLHKYLGLIKRSEIPCIEAVARDDVVRVINEKEHT